MNAVLILVLHLAVFYLIPIDASFFSRTVVHIKTNIKPAYKNTLRIFLYIPQRAPRVCKYNLKILIKNRSLYVS